MVKLRDPDNPQHDIDFAHYGEMPYSLLPSGSYVSTLAWVVDGGGSAITAGTKGSVPVFLDCTIEGVTLLADVSGSCQLDIYKDVYGNYPPNSGDSITDSNKPALSNAMKSQNSLSGWVVDINFGDVLRFQVISSSTIKQLTCALQLRKA